LLPLSPPPPSSDEALADLVVNLLSKESPELPDVMAVIRIIIMSVITIKQVIRIWNLALPIAISSKYSDKGYYKSFYWVLFFKFLC
jgi:isoprenylcysteine carboxyl methyltransferase (ICMT) family protein YpbQ